MLIGCIWNSVFNSPDELWGEAMAGVCPDGNDSYGGMLLADIVPRLNKWFRNKSFGSMTYVTIVYPVVALSK